MKEVHRCHSESGTGNYVIAPGTSSSLEMRGLVQKSLRSILALMLNFFFNSSAFFPSILGLFSEFRSLQPFLELKRYPAYLPLFITAKHLCIHSFMCVLVKRTFYVELVY